LSKRVLVFDRDGNVSLIEHHQRQKCRTICNGDYEPSARLPHDSLLRQFFALLPYNDPEQDEKHRLIQEVFGVAVAGLATRIPQPKSFVLFGRSANNGKSAVLDMLEGLVTSCAHVSAHQFNEMNIMIQMRGALLNTSSELTSSNAVSSARLRRICSVTAILGTHQDRLSADRSARY
jgi:hypothetical protein